MEAPVQVGAALDSRERVRRARRRPRLLIALLALGVPRLAAAQTGVSDDRVSLPDGPGSLEGVGDNVSIDSNMGLMRYSVPIEVPEGHPGMAPALALTYSSGAGSSVVGIGWSLDVPFIERMTLRGLPRYGLEDGFALDGGEELVKVPGTDPPVYRARFEGSFVRYTWQLAGTGAEGYFRAEYPDGRIGYFGADATGALVPDARVFDPADPARRTFRYHLVEMVDRFGHRTVYTYQPEGSSKLIQHIDWVYSGAEPTYQVTFLYEAREDRLSDCRAGFEELLESRLGRIDVWARGTGIRAYELGYEDYTSSGGLSRLASVQMLGFADEPYPVHQAFAYSQSLGGQTPYVHVMGDPLGGTVATAATTLVDLNGDSLPDMVDTSDTGAPHLHHIYLNTLDGSGGQTFAAPYESLIGTASAYGLASPVVKALDVDGDGFTDVVNAQSGAVLHNLGGGDWEGPVSLPYNAAVVTALQSGSARFLDYDSDRRIDIVYSAGEGTANVTRVYRNDPTLGFVEDATVEAIGFGFESDRVELNDMNGDGLLDPVRVTMTGVEYRLNLGWGRWSEVRTAALRDTGGATIAFDPAQQVAAELEDLNGDSLADLVLVAGGTVHYWLNRNGAYFDAERQLTSSEVAGLPVAAPGTVVLFADMNGNGSADVVWIDTTGLVTYLEMFALRPNLLTQVTNGLGKVTEVSYAASVSERARDAGGAYEWPDPLPHAMTVVTRLDDADTLTGVHEITDCRYHGGYYDGDEKQFRGYRVTERVRPGTAASEESTTLETWDVGRDDDYRKGLLLARELLGVGGRRLLAEGHEYQECAVAGAEDTAALERPVRRVCPLRTTTEIVEDCTGFVAGCAAPAPVTTQVEYAYDGYGNVTLTSDLGVVSVGGGGCGACDGSWSGAPCGTGCTGDESYESFAYAVPTGDTPPGGSPWIVDRPILHQTYGRADVAGAPATASYTEEKYYYDGSAFQGLDYGELGAAGALTRRTLRRAAGGTAVVQAERNRIDAHGNVIEQLDPLGDPAGNGHRRRWTYDADGLRVVRAEILLEDGAGPYQLRRDYQYDLLWDKPVEATSWMLVRGGTSEARRSTSYTYDGFGRLASTTLPGGNLAAPTEELTYEIGSPSSRVVVRQRSQHDLAQPDREQVTCHDGHGRVYQTRSRVAAGEYLVSGFTVFDGMGNEQETYQAYTATAGSCDAAPASGTLSVTREFDALERVVGELWPDADPGTPAEMRAVYGPLVETVYDLEDTRSASPHFDTPTTTRRNGLGRRVAVEQESAPGTAIVTRFLYDDLGRPAGWVDAAGNRHSEQLDLLGRPVQIDDPDRGVTTLAYDDAGNLTQRTDARGVTVAYQYDGANRLVGMCDQAHPATCVENRYDTPGTCPAARCTNVSGRLATTSYPLDGARVGEDHHGYDARGNLVRFERVVGDKVLAFESEFDNAGNATGNSFPNGQRFDLELDGRGRVTAVPGYLTGVTYDDRGQLAGITAANGVVTRRTYDYRQRLASIVATAGGSAEILDYTYVRDRQGNITAITDGRTDDGAPMGGARYQYDALYRMTRAELDPDRSGHAETITVAYDALGRITSKVSSLGAGSPAHVGSYAYGAGGTRPNAVTSAGDVTLAYDAAGNLVARGGDTYTWDWLGRMAGASRGAAERASFVYAGSGGRLIKRELGGVTYYLASDFEVEDGVASAYLRIDSARVVRVEDPTFAPLLLSDVAPAAGADDALVSSPDAAITAADAWLAIAVGGGTLAFGAPTSLSDPGELLMASVARMLAGTEQTVAYLHEDQLGSVAAVTDEDGALVSRSEYYPYGSLRYRSGPGDRHGFSGLESDEGTGLVHAGARELDPWTGRFVSPDPAFARLDGERVATTRADEVAGAYSYALGNPVNNVDETGLESDSTIAGVVWGYVKAAARAIWRAIRPGSARTQTVVRYMSRFEANRTAEAGVLRPGAEKMENVNSRTFVTKPGLPVRSGSQAQRALQLPVAPEVCAECEVPADSFTDFAQVEGGTKGAKEASTTKLVRVLSMKVRPLPRSTKTGKTGTSGQPHPGLPARKGAQKFEPRGPQGGPR